MRFQMLIGKACLLPLPDARGDWVAEALPDGAINDDLVDASSPSTS
jgi:hypothetical protein